MFEDEDALELDPDPITGGWELSFDGSDFDPDWQAADLDALDGEAGLARINIAAPVRIIAVAIDPAANPALFELRMDCASQRVTQIATGLILPPSLDPTLVTVGPARDDRAQHG